MKQKLLYFLAVLLTGGMLVACGPGDETADDGVAGGGGVVEDPLTAEGDDAFGADAGETDFAGEDNEAEDAEFAEEGDDVDVAVAEEGEADDAEFAEETEAETTIEDPFASVEGEETEETAEGEETEEAEMAEAEGEEVAGGGAAAPAGEPVVITFTQAAEGVAVENVRGGDDSQEIASTDETNPDLNLTTGQRYEFEYDGEGDFVIYNSDNEPILSSAGTDSAFAQDAEVDAQAENGKLSFTLTEELGQELDHYAVGPDEQGGRINVE